MRTYSLLFAVYALMIAGCAQVTPPSGEVADWRNRCRDTADDTRSRWNYIVADDSADPFPREAEKIRNDLEANITAGSHVVVFAHGGLVSEDDIRARAAKIECVMKAQAHPIIPIFLIWRTGPFETYGDELRRIGNGDDTGSYLIAPVNIAKDLGSGLVRFPMVTIQAIGRQVGLATNGGEFEIYDTGAPFPGIGPYCRAKSTDRYNNVIVPCGGAGWNDNCASIRAEEQDILQGKVKDRTIWDVRGREREACGSSAAGQHSWFAENLKYVAATPVRVMTSVLTTGTGQSAWTNMLRRTRMTFRRNVEYDPQSMMDAETLLTLDQYPEGTGTFGLVFRKLRDMRQARPGNFRLTLIGHSMGAIVMDEALLAYPELDYDDVVYIAAAAKIAEVSQALTPVLREPRNPRARFYNLMLHPRAEAKEINYFATVPSGSLLKWIDEVYGEPLSPAYKTAGAWGNVRAAKAVFPADVQRKMVFRVFGLEDGKDPMSHSDFIRSFCFWDPAFWVNDDFRWTEPVIELPRMSPTQLEACNRHLRALDLD